MNIFIVAIVAWAVAQFLKGVVLFVKEKRIDFHASISPGGMPSSHSAIVSSLCASVAILQGLDSVAFGISAIVAIIVMYDAAGLRRSVGRQAVVLNRIVEELKDRPNLHDLEHNLRELIGHTGFQVFIGACLGIGISFLWFKVIS